MATRKFFLSAKNFSGPFFLPLARSGRRFTFSAHFFLIWLIFAFLLSALLYAAGWVPEGVSELGNRAVALFRSRTDAPVYSGTAPSGAIDRNPRILIPDIGVAAPIVFPGSTGLNVLNEALLEGVVHYPGSSLPGEEGTVFLFGHSTGLRVVQNKNFEVFNRLSELDAGDIIRLRYGGREHWYRVRSVKIEKADAAIVDLRSSGERLLVLSTCRIFGEIDERFIVTAEFVRSYPLERA